MGPSSSRSLCPAQRCGAGRGGPGPAADWGCPVLFSNALFVAREEPPSAAQREAVHAASTCPAPWTANVSPSSLGSTGKGCQQQPSQGGTRSDSSQQPARARAGARAWGSSLVLCPPPIASHRAHRLHLPPGPSAASTARDRQWRQLHPKAPTASSAWSPWGTARPTRP